MTTAINNSLQKPSKQEKNTSTFKVGGMEVKLTPDIVRNYLVSGDKERVTMQEIAVFINLCRYSQLNPWLKEAYCIKYGNEPATMVVGKSAFEKRAEDHQAYDGSEAGIIVFDKETGDVTYRKGTLKLPSEELVGGYAEVWRKDRNHSTRIEVSFEEYAGRKKDGSLNRQWAAKPATMIRKVALVQALREAFPKVYTGMYTAEEQNIEEPEYSIVDSVTPEQVAQIQSDVMNETSNPVSEVQNKTNSDNNVSSALFG